MKTAGFDARAVANHFLDLAGKHSIPLTNLHLQKVIFFSHGNFIIRTGLDLILNRFEAWDHGPVVPELYHALKKYDDRKIDGRAQRYDFISKAYVDVLDDFALSTTSFLEEMLMFYGRMNPWELVKLSHAKGGPWAVTMERSKYEANFAMVIDPAVIRGCFRGPNLGTVKH
jgi:uncharacterized phage-associated protein